MTERGTWGPLLRQYRERAGLSRFELGELVKRSSSTVLKWELGQRPGRQVAAAVAAVCQCSAEETAELVRVVDSSWTPIRPERLPPLLGSVGPDAQTWHTRLVRMVAVATMFARSGVSEEELTELVNYMRGSVGEAG